MVSSPIPTKMGSQNGFDPRCSWLVAHAARPAGLEDARGVVQDLVVQDVHDVPEVPGAHVLVAWSFGAAHEKWLGNLDALVVGVAAHGASLDILTQVLLVEGTGTREARRAIHDFHTDPWELLPTDVTLW